MGFSGAAPEFQPKISTDHASCLCSRPRLAGRQPVVTERLFEARVRPIRGLRRRRHAGRLLSPGRGRSQRVRAFRGGGGRSPMGAWSKTLAASKQSRLRHLKEQIRRDRASRIERGRTAAGLVANSVRRHRSTVIHDGCPRYQATNCCGGPRPACWIARQGRNLSRVCGAIR